MIKAYPRAHRIVRERSGSRTGETLYQTDDGSWWTTEDTAYSGTGTTRGDTVRRGHTDDGWIVERGRRW